MASQHSSQDSALCIRHDVSKRTGYSYLGLRVYGFLSDSYDSILYAKMFQYTIWYLRLFMPGLKWWTLVNKLLSNTLWISCNIRIHGLQRRDDWKWEMHKICKFRIYIQSRDKQIIQHFICIYVYYLVVVHRMNGYKSYIVVKYSLEKYTPRSLPYYTK